MKKITALLIYIALILSVSACVKSGDTSLKSGIYTLQNEEDVLGNFTITIYGDGVFEYYETPISSYIGRGRYSIEKDIVTLKEDKPGYNGMINYYQIVEGDLQFISEDSDNYHFVSLEDGALFTWTSDVP